VLGGATGTELWSTTLSAPTRSSPVFSNGRLVAATDAGIVHSFLSISNQPPVVSDLGLAPADGQDVGVDGSIVLRWGAATDLDSTGLRYQVRVDDDGEVLRDWDHEVLTPPDQLQLAIDLPPGRTFTFAVRARDPNGALSAWTGTQSFRTVGSPGVSLDGQPGFTLAGALALAKTGQTIKLGAGVFLLSATQRLPAGVVLEGAGPHLTVLRARGLGIGVQAEAGSQLRNLTVREGRVGVQVDATPAVTVQNVILRDNADVGLQVGNVGSANLISATVLRNGTGVQVAGTGHVRDCIVTVNAVGLAAVAGGRLDTRYNDVFGNLADDFRNALPASTDLMAPVGFATGLDGDLHLPPSQPSTDHGDPSDEYAREPAPNGKRINLGAFGNTEFAELSSLAPPEVPPVQNVPDAGIPGGNSDPNPTAAASGDDGGCGVAPRRERRGPRWLLSLAALALLIARRRRP
jgi:MYXO-CTERM domain-containing protein